MDTVSLLLAIIGAINWGLVGIFQFDLVAWIFGGQAAGFSRVIYTLVGLAGLWCISLLNILLIALGTVLFGVIPGVALGIAVLLQTAMTMIYLHGYRGQEVHSLQLFDCFRDGRTVKRVLCGMLWAGLWVLLWSLIPVVGPIFGLIRLYEYRLTPYILMTEPDVAPTDAREISRQRTEGFKGKMFGADILAVLAVMGVYLVLALLCLIPIIGKLFALIYLLFHLCVLAFLPLFLGLVQSAFYEEITAFWR